MSNLIQIKRSNTSSTPTTTLNSGELAFSYNSNNIFIGAQTGIGSSAVLIGGSKYQYLNNLVTPGTLTATAALVTDANSYVTNTYTQGLFISNSTSAPATNSTAAFITSISPQANTTQLGATAGGVNTELVTSYAIKTYVDAKAANAAVNTAQTYTFTAIENFNANVQLAGNSSSELLIGTTSANIVANATQITLSTNSTLAATINSTAFSGTANNSTNFGGLSLATVQGQITGNSATAYTNTISYLTAGGYTVTANVNYTGTVNASSFTLGSALTTNSTVIAFTGGTINAASATISAAAINTGNLTVSGTLTSINSINLQVNDNVILLADQQASTNTFTDNVDSGFVTQTGNTSAVFYSGIARIASSSSNTNPYYKIFATANAAVVTNTTIDTTATTGTLQAYLTPYGSAGVFVVNSTAVSITANSTVSANITANNITISTPLAVGSGGTGLNTIAIGSILYGNTTGSLSTLAIPGAAANGQVLQIVNNMPAYGTLDGGNF